MHKKMYQYLKFKKSRSCAMTDIYPPESM